MSRAPSQCGPSSSDQRYTHQVRQVSYHGYHGVPASSNQSYSTQELPRFLYPDNQGYDPTIATRPPGFQRFWQGNRQSSDANRKYKAVIYRDASEADYETNPTAIEIEEREVTNADTLSIWQARSGGTAIQLCPLEE